MKYKYRKFRKLKDNKNIMKFKSVKNIVWPTQFTMKNHTPTCA